MLQLCWLMFGFKYLVIRSWYWLFIQPGNSSLLHRLLHSIRINSQNRLSILEYIHSLMLDGPVLPGYIVSPSLLRRSSVHYISSDSKRFLWNCSRTCIKPAMSLKTVIHMHVIHASTGSYYIYLGCSHIQACLLLPDWHRFQALHFFVCLVFFSCRGS